MKEDKNFSFNIDEYIGSLKESTSHDWAKAVLRIAWNEKPSTLDIRNVNMAQQRIGKGISLSNEEADRLVAILLEQDYGTIDDLERALKRKRSFFQITNDIDEVLDNDELYTINIT